MSSSQAIPKYDLDKLFQLHYEIRETGEMKNDLRPEKMRAYIEQDVYMYLVHKDFRRRKNERKIILPKNIEILPHP